MGQPPALGFGVKWEGTAGRKHYPRPSPLCLLAWLCLQPGPDPRADFRAGGGRKEQRVTRSGCHGVLPANDVIWFAGWSPRTCSGFSLLASPPSQPQSGCRLTQPPSFSRQTFPPTPGPPSGQPAPLASPQLPFPQTSSKVPGLKGSKSQQSRLKKSLHS